MIEAILPAGVVAETGEDEEVAALFPEEEKPVARAVEKRRRRFAGGRACARRALATLGFPPGPIGAGERGGADLAVRGGWVDHPLPRLQ